MSVAEALKSERFMLANARVCGCRRKHRNCDSGLHASSHASALCRQAVSGEEADARDKAVCAPVIES